MTTETHSFLKDVESDLKESEATTRRLQRLRDELKRQLIEMQGSAPLAHQPVMASGRVTVADLSGMGVKDAIRHFARQNGRDFKPQLARPVLVAAALLKSGATGSNELNKTLEGMPEMTHKRRNLWVFTEPSAVVIQPSTVAAQRIVAPAVPAAPSATVGPVQPKYSFEHNGYRYWSTPVPGAVALTLKTDEGMKTFYRVAMKEAPVAAVPA